MKPISEKFLDQAEDVASIGLDAMRAFLTYQGENPIYQAKAKVGVAAYTAYSRLRATETNRAQIELAAKKLT